MVEQALERIRHVLVKHPPAELLDRRFVLACHAVSGLATATAPGTSAEEIGRRAVEIADATLRSLKVK
jgi:hypothetical protein